MMYISDKTNELKTLEQIKQENNVSLPYGIENYKEWHLVHYQNVEPENKFQVIKEGEIVLIDGLYTQTRYLEYVSLDEAKRMLTEELEEKFLNATNEAHVMSSLGFEIDANNVANRDVQGLIVTMECESAPETTSFCDYYNELHEVTLEDVKTIRIEIIRCGQNLYRQKWGYRYTINTSEKIEELVEIDINFQYTKER